MILPVRGLILPKSCCLFVVSVLNPLRFNHRTYNNFSTIFLYSLQNIEASLHFSLAGNNYEFLIQKAVTTLQCLRYKRPQRVTRSCLRLMHQFLLLLTYHLYIRLNSVYPITPGLTEGLLEMTFTTSFFSRKVTR